jgi:hypothetical protein
MNRLNELKEMIEALKDLSKIAIDLKHTGCETADMFELFLERQKMKWPKS